MQLKAERHSLFFSFFLQTPPEGTDPNIQNSYMVNESVGGEGNGTLTPLGQTYTSITC